MSKPHAHLTVLTPTEPNKPLVSVRCISRIGSVSSSGVSTLIASSTSLSHEGYFGMPRRPSAFDVSFPDERPPDKSTSFADHDREERREQAAQAAPPIQRHLKRAERWDDERREHEHVRKRILLFPVDVPAW